LVFVEVPSDCGHAEGLAGHHQYSNKIHNPGIACSRTFSPFLAPFSSFFGAFFALFIGKIMVQIYIQLAGHHQYSNKIHNPGIACSRTFSPFLAPFSSFFGAFFALFIGKIMVQIRPKRGQK
jgi:hypothetical protein